MSLSFGANAVEHHCLQVGSEVAGVIFGLPVNGGRGEISKLLGFEKLSNEILFSQSKLSKSYSKLLLIPAYQYNLKFKMI